MKLSLFPAVLVSLFTIACCSAQKAPAPSAIWNNSINQKLRNEIKLLDDKLIASFYDGNAQKLKSLYSRQLMDGSGSKFETFMKTVHPIFESKNHSLFDECLYTSSAIGGFGKVSKTTAGDNNYDLNFKIYNKETYVSLIICPGSNDESLVTAIYSKNGRNWQLEYIHVGLLKIFGKNAIDFYKQAKKNVADNDLLDAASNIRLAQQAASPAENAFVYVKLQEVKEFSTKFYQLIRSKFPLPMTMAGVSTSPQMFDIEPAVLKDGCYPVISYLSTIGLQNMAALTQENEEVKKAVVKMSPGINKNKKYVIFNVYNQFPNANTETNSYRFVWKIK